METFNNKQRTASTLLPSTLWKWINWCYSEKINYSSDYAVGLEYMNIVRYYLYIDKKEDWILFELTWR